MAIRVALVEDNYELRESLQQLIQKAPGLQCSGAFPTCEQFLAALGTLRADVVLMDIGLPGMSGIEGVRKLKERRPAVDVLMLTVHEESDLVFDSICAGASGYLLKKTPPSQILASIRELRTGGAPMSPRVARKVLEKFRRQRPDAPAGANLSERERQVLSALVEGMSYKMIAHDCAISIDTVRSHIKSIYEKLHVHSKAEAVARALRDRPS